MRFLILYPNSTPRESNAFGWFIEVGKKLGIDVLVGFFEDYDKLLEIDRLSDLHLDKLPDVVLMRGYDFPLSLYFEERGVRVVNTALAMALSRNKVATGLLLENNGIAMPRTLFLGNVLLDRSISKDIYPESLLGGNAIFVDAFSPNDDLSNTCFLYKNISEYFASEIFVLKQISGSKGENVYLIHNEHELLSAVQECQRNVNRDELLNIDMQELVRNHILFQEYIENSCGKDVRVWVIGDEVVGSVLRHNEKSFKSNYAQGGSADRFDLSQSGRDIAIKAAKVLGLDFAGVDLLFVGKDAEGQDLFTVCEVNGNAGFRTASIVGIDKIPEKLLAYCSR